MKRTLILVTLALLAMLAACTQDDDGEDIPQPQPRTLEVAAPTGTSLPPSPIVVTQVVTVTPLPVLPTDTPPPTSTPDPNLAQFQGRWSLLMDYQIADSRTLGLDSVQYSAASSLIVSPEGSVVGIGTFGQAITFGECPVRLLNSSGPSFTVRGQIRPDASAGEAGYVMDITITPDDPGFIESYETACQNDLATPTVRTVEAPLLWRSLQTGNLLSFQFDLTQLFGVRSETDLNMNLLTNGDIDGDFTGQVYLGYEG